VQKVISFDWYAPTRAERLAEVFNGHQHFSPEDCVRLQSDVASLPARRIVRRLAKVQADDPATARAQAMLTGWDGDLGADSAPAALFEIWYRRHLRPALLRRALEQTLPEDQIEAALQAVAPDETLLADPRVDLDLIERPAGRLGPDADATLDEILRSSLREAVADTEQLLGQDRERWAWGRLHVSRLVHPLSLQFDEPTRERLAVGPVPRGGSADTVGNTAYTPDFVQSGGSTFRIVVDVGDWDRSLVMNSPGQSGNPDNPHYADLFERWAGGEAFPLLYSHDAVEAATERRIHLRPPEPH
jgi:penicillin amidase